MLVQTRTSDGIASGDGSAPTPTPTGQLRAELESARHCIEQLRREKADEARRAREQSDSALRQLAERLREERQRVIEQVFDNKQEHTVTYNMRPSFQLHITTIRYGIIIIIIIINNNIST